MFCKLLFLQVTEIAGIAEEGVLSEVTVAEMSTPAPEPANGLSSRIFQRSKSFQRALGPTIVCIYALILLKTAQQGFTGSLSHVTARHPFTRKLLSHLYLLIQSNI